MRKLTALILIFVFAAHVCAEELVCPRALSPAVEAKLKPVLSARDRAAKRNDWWDKGYEREIGILFNAKDRASIEARVALMDYYIGEAYGEELVCVIALDGAETVKLLELYEQCDIQPKRNLGLRRHGSPLRGYAKRLVQEGHAKESCTYD